MQQQQLQPYQQPHTIIIIITIIRRPTMSYRLSTHSTDLLTIRLRLAQPLPKVASVPIHYFKMTTWPRHKHRHNNMSKLQTTITNTNNNSQGLWLALMRRRRRPPISQWTQPRTIFTRTCATTTPIQPPLPHHHHHHHRRRCRRRRPRHQMVVN